MKLKFKIFPVLLLFILAEYSNAQFKKIDFDPNLKVNIEEVRMQPKENVTVKSKSSYTDVNFKSMDFHNLIALKTGLKPGIINERNVPSYIEGNLTVKGKRGYSTENLALEYLEFAAPLMQIKYPREEFKITHSYTDDLNFSHVRMQQLVKGIPVYGAEILLHGNGNDFDFLNGVYFPSITMENTIPAIEANRALHLTAADLGNTPQYENEISKIGNLLPESNLVIYPFENRFILAYHITAYKNLVERWEYFMDANSGEIIKKYQSICKFHNHKHINGETCTNSEPAEILSSKNLLVDGKATANAPDLFNVNRLINTYEVSTKFYLIDGSRDIFASSPSKLPNDPEGVIWTIDAFNTSPQKDNFNYDHVTSSNNSWNNKTAVSAHYNGGKAFEYFRNVHNRKSINGQGGNIVSLINVADEDGKTMGNAFWNGQAMFYGNGDGAFLSLARGLDVAGHEMTHGVIQSTANLEYEGESGALNESFADVFGALIDREDWKIGEDVVRTSAFPSGALRSLEDPHNGASTNNFNEGWQPRHYSERYKGNEDNGGVHINSGIPNWAFFKFATSIGKDKAEKVYYRALNNYLTKSSKFVDCRIAVIKAATDLYSTPEINAAKKAFDEVGILGESGGDYETDLGVNPGQEFILTTGANNVGIFVYSSNGQSLGQISTKGVLSKPSISDDGSEVVFIGTDNKMYYITIDWSKNPAAIKEQVLQADPVWRNTIISKDGLKIAALTKEEKNEIVVFYFGGTAVTSNVFELYNPTYSEGITTGDVNFADAMEFDITGDYIIYDAENEIKSSSSGSIQYWDISFLKVWNKASNTFSLGEIEKLYSSLPEEVSIGNPTFSKNSPYIIAFDYIDGNGDVSILGANIETGEAGLIFENNTLGYPNFTSKDDNLLFDNEGTSSLNLGIALLKSNKIEPSAAPTLFVGSKRWAVGFSNGKRVLSETEELTASDDIQLTSNPTHELLIFHYKSENTLNSIITISDMTGRVMLQRNFAEVNKGNKAELNVSDLSSGIYILNINNGIKNASVKFVKI